MDCRPECAGTWVKIRRAANGSCLSNRRRTMLKILAFDTGGYWIWSKRLEQGQFALGRGAKGGETGAESHRVAGAGGGRGYKDSTPEETLSEDCLNDSRVDRFRSCSIQEGA